MPKKRRRPPRPNIEVSYIRARDACSLMRVAITRTATLANAAFEAISIFSPLPTRELKDAMDQLEALVYWTNEAAKAALVEAAASIGRLDRED